MDRNNLRKHSATQKHLNAASAVKFPPSVSLFDSADQSAEVTCSKLLFASFLVEHSIPSSASDHAGPFFWKMFPDSELAKKCGAARTQTSCRISPLVDSSQSK